MGTTKECYALFWTNPETSSPQTAAAQPPTSHLTNHPSKLNNALLVKQGWQISDILSWMCKCWPMNKNFRHLNEDTGYRLEDLLGVLNNWDGWRERVKEIGSISMMMMMICILTISFFLSFSYSSCYVLTFDPAQKCYSKVMHRKEVTHSNGQ